MYLATTGNWLQGWVFELILKIIKGKIEIKKFLKATHIFPFFHKSVGMINIHSVTMPYSRNVR